MGEGFDLVIFDCDGVLIDSEVISARTLMALVEPFGLKLTMAEVQQHFLGRSFPTVAATIRSEFKVTLPPEFAATYRRDLLVAFETQLRPTVGIAETLARLKIPFCVATSSSPPRVARSLELTGLADAFGSRVFTASEVRRGKPAPDLFLHAARKCGADPSKCLVVEDSEPGLQAAEAAGMRAIRYVGGEHLQGSLKALKSSTTEVAVFDSWVDFGDIMIEVGANRGEDGHQK